MPSFSKKCLGGFVGFRRNLQVVVLQIFQLRNGNRGSRALEPVGFGGTAWKDRSIYFVFPKGDPLHLSPREVDISSFGRCATQRISACNSPSRAEAEVLVPSAEVERDFSAFFAYDGAMKRDEVLRKLKEAEADLRAKGVAHAALFGSVARGEDRPDSDIDIMVDLDPDLVVTIFDYVGVKDFISDMFNDPVDVVSREGLKPFVRPKATTDAIYAF